LTIGTARVNCEQTYRPRTSTTCDFDFGTSANLRFAQGHR